MCKTDVDFYALQAPPALAVFEHTRPIFFMHTDLPGYSNNNR